MRPNEAEPVRTVQTIPYNTTVTIDALEQWAKIPIPCPTIHTPEWQPTPITSIDLAAYGYGTVHIKREDMNVSGTNKARAAYEHAKQYGMYAKLLLRALEKKQISQAEIEHMTTPHLSVITSGNEGRALATIFEKYRVPPPKLLIDSSALHADYSGLYANVYQTDLQRAPLHRADIVALTNNTGGTDINGSIYLEPQKVYYNWLVHEVFNQQPDFVYIPFGSGRLLENFVYWQRKTGQNYIQNTNDFRLTVSADCVTNIHVVAGEPAENNSIADKLTAPYKPFRFFSDADIALHAASPFSGRNTCKELVAEAYIEYAYHIFCAHSIPTEPSGAVGLALYLQQYDRYRTSSANPLHSSKVVIINTGCGPSAHVQYEQKKSANSMHSTLSWDGQP